MAANKSQLFGYTVRLTTQTIASKCECPRQDVAFIAMTGYSSTCKGDCKVRLFDGRIRTMYYKYETYYTRTEIRRKIAVFTWDLFSCLARHTMHVRRIMIILGITGKSGQ